MITASGGSTLGLSGVVGVRVTSPDGDPVGRLIDLTVHLDDDHPRVRRLVIGRRKVRSYVEWPEVRSLDARAVVLDPKAAGPGELDTRELRLVRDVLDTQVVDVVGKRLARVSEVLLARAGDDLRVVGVDVGVAAIVRRLGLPWLARYTDQRVLDWSDLHLASVRGHALTLATPKAAVHRLDPGELSALVARLPAPQALALSHQHLGTDVADALPGGRRFAAIRRRPRRRRPGA